MAELEISLNPVSQLPIIYRQSEIFFPTYVVSREGRSSVSARVEVGEIRRGGASYNMNSELCLCDVFFFYNLQTGTDVSFY